MKRFYSHMALLFIALFVVISNFQVCGKNAILLDSRQFSPLYIIGQVEGQGWSADKGVPMSTTDGNIYTGKVTFSDAGTTATFALATQLGANADDWDTLNANRFGSGTDGAVLGNNSESNFQPIASTAFAIQVGEYDITVNMQNKTILAVSTTPLPAVYPESLYLIGQIEGIEEWKPNSGIKLDYDGEGVFMGIVTFKHNATWGMVEILGGTDTDWDKINARRYGPSADSQLLLDDVETPISKNTNAAKVSGGEYIIIVNFANMTVTVSPTETPEPVYPDKLYVLGQVWEDAEMQWKTDDDSFPLNKTSVEGEYKGSVTFFADAESDAAYFAITSQVGPTWDDVNPFRYGPVENNQPVVENVESAIAKIDNSYSVAKSEKPYEITVNLKNKTIVLKTLSGVCDIPENDGVTVTGLKGEIRIDGDTANVEVFSSNGILISKDKASVQCVPGIYFVRTGAKVTKVAVR